MATETFEIVFVSRGARRVDRNIASIGKSANVTSKALGFLRAALVVVASARVLTGLTDLADAFTNVGNRLKLVTNNAQELAAVQAELFRVSQETRTSFEGNATLFNRLARSTTRLGLTFKELLDITQGIGQAIAISGAQTQEARNALIQFSQGLAAGALRGDELRSVVEQLPALADIIGREFGVAGGELIAFAKASDGALVTERVIKAIQTALPGLSSEFAKLRPTISQSFEVFNNALIQFIGGVDQATGAAASLAEGIIFLADNIDQVALAVAAFVSVFALNLIIAQVATLGQTFAALGRVAVRALVAIGAAVKNLVTLFGLLRIAVITNPLFIAGVAVVGALTAAFLIFEEEINNVIDSLGGFTQIFENIANVGVAAVMTIIEGWSILPRAIGDLAIQAGNFLVRGLEAGVNASIDLLNLFAGVDIVDPASLARIPNQFAGAAAEAAALFNENLKEIEDAGGTFDIVEDRINQIQELFRSFADPGQTFDPAQLEALLGGTPRGGEAGAGLDAFSTAAKKARDALEGLLSSISPLLSLEFELADAQETLNKALAKGIDLRLEQSEILRRIEREAIGVGNAQTDFIEQQELLNSALERGVITVNEYQRAISDLENELNSAFNSLVDSVDRNIAANRQLAEAQLVLNDAVDRGLINLESSAEIYTRLQRELAGVGNAESELLQQQELLNQALADGAITAEEFATANRNAQIAFLETQRDSASGAERAFLKLEDQVSDLATLTEQTLTSAFDTASDAVVDFVQNGSASLEGFKDIIKSVAASLIKLGLQQALVAGGNAAGFGQGGGAGGGPGGLISGLFFGGGGGAAGGGAGGAAGGGFLSGLFGFQNGGSFTVGKSTSVSQLNGADNRLVAFKAQDGEEVSVTPRGQTAGGGTVIFNVNTPDAGSFRRSQTQLENKAASGLDRSRSRR